MGFARGYTAAVVISEEVIQESKKRRQLEDVRDIETAKEVKRKKDAYNAMKKSAALSKNGGAKRKYKKKQAVVGMGTTSIKGIFLPIAKPAGARRGSGSKDQGKQPQEFNNILNATDIGSLASNDVCSEEEVVLGRKGIG